MKDYKTVVRLLDEAILEGTAAAIKFAGRLGREPVSALVWSNETFCAVAAMDVAERIKAWLDTGATNALDKETALAAVVAEVKAELVRLARNPPFSSSPTSNLMDTYTAAAYADFLDRIGG